MKYTEKISKQLNELLIKNYDAEKGYLNAANSVNSERLKVFFNKCATERSTFAKDLRTEILKYGEEPSATGSFKGIAHRNWISLKSLFSTNNEEVILEEALKGENASLDAYNDLIKSENLPSNIEALLLKQKNAIKDTIEAERVHEEMVS